MASDFFTNQSFKKQDYTTNLLPKGEYDCCTFINCNFENSEIANITFLECEFIDCNLSNTNITHTKFQDVEFKNCKMVGLEFQNLDEFLRSFSFTECQLDYSTFIETNIDNTKFDNCKLIGVDFTEASAKKVKLLNCNLADAIFSKINLEQTDFYSAHNYTIEPHNNRLTKAIFNINQLEGLLKSTGIIIKQ